MTFTRGQRVRITGNSLFHSLNLGKTGTYIAENPCRPGYSIVVVDGGWNGYTMLNGEFNINGYDYGLTSKLEPVVDGVTEQGPVVDLVDDPPTFKLYRSMSVVLQNSLNGQTNQPTKKTLMRKLSELSATIRRTFSPDQKALWRTGRIDDAGKPTQQAIQEALQELALAYIKEHQADFVAAAKEELEIEEQEKE